MYTIILIPGAQKVPAAHGGVHVPWVYKTTHM